jgi:spermidine/putrescine transport system permease protein
VSALGHLGTAVEPGGAPPPASEPVAGARRRRLLPYLLLLPGGLWLTLFFAVPIVQLAATSLYDPSGSLERGYAMTWQVSNYADAVSAYGPHLLRSFLYAGVATVVCLVLGYPLAYAIAQKAGRWKNLMLIAVIAPFFTSFLVRTLAWKTILSDNGWLVGVLRDVHILGADGRLLATPIAVVAGLTYNFLPFMVLPLYASLEKLDGRLLEAATLLTFIPAAGDYINAELLGTPQTRMIGNVIQSRFLVVNDLPHAAALSFLLMAAILAIVFVYVRRAGTEEVL